MRQHDRRVDRRARLALEKRMRPSLAANAPSKHHENGAGHERQSHSSRARRRIPDRILSHDSADRSAENVIRVLCAIVERLRNDTDEGNRRTDCVTYRRIAAARVPSEEAFGCQPQSGDAMLSLHKRKRGGRDLHDVRTTLDIEQVGTTELMCKRLAIVAVAYHAIDCPRRCVRKSPANFPATAPKISLGDHVWPVLQSP